VRSGVGTALVACTVGEPSVCAELAVALAAEGEAIIGEAVFATAQPVAANRMTAAARQDARPELGSIRQPT
jgi:hypothetical protein